MSGKDYNSPESVERRKAMRAVEACFDSVKFDDLYRFAWEVCLDAEYENMREDGTPPSPEKRLINKLGTRGLSVALDMAVGTEVQKGTRNSDEDDPLKQPIQLDSVFRYPEQFSRSITPEIATKIERFGQRILDEAYHCLGTDANEYLRKFKNATTADEQVAVLEWLSERVDRIGCGETDLNAGGEEFYYSPMRLSPKILGAHPHANYDPTCLMRSILTASFLEKAEAPYLHAGVMQTRLEESLRRTAEAIYYVAQDDTELEPAVRDLYKNVARQAYFQTPNVGFHAVSLTQLHDKSWYVLDPNYDATYAVKLSQDNEQITEAYRDITELRPLSSDIERVVSLKTFFIPLALAYMSENVGMPIDERRMHDILTDQTAENILARAKQVMLDAVEALDDEFEDSKDTKTLFGYLSDVGVRPGTTIFDDVFEAVWAKFVMWRENPVDVIARCRVDEAYLQRRLKDVQNLPKLVAIEAARQLSTVNFGDEEYQNTAYHTRLELGSPAYRIGAAVLSDFASYYGDELTPDFWYTHWASRIPITERGTSGTLSESQASVRSNTMAWLNKALHYNTQSGIIDEYYSSE